jgi:hypothetical protein
MKELIDELGSWGEGESGYEKFCTSLNLPGRPGLGTIEMGEDWNRPISEDSSKAVNGPRYLFLVISLSKVFTNSS